MPNFKEFEYPLQIKETHLDTFGHVNNATYLQLYEEARWELITTNGYGLKEIRAEQKGPVVLDITISFKRELLNRDRIVIKSFVSDLKGKIMSITQQMIKEDGTLASEATFTVGYLDLKARRLIKPSAEWLHAVGLVEA
jgi:thioesterase III